MKSLLFFIFLSAFSIIAFGQKEGPVEQTETQKTQEAEAPEEKQTDKIAVSKRKQTEASMAQKAVASKKEQAKAPVAQKAVAPKKEQAKAPVAQKAVAPKKEQTEALVAQEVKAVEEKPETVVQTSSHVDSGVSVQTGVRYECDENKSYTLHEPGVNSESNLCELDAGHTEAPVDWYALHESSFCRQKLKEITTQYNCVAKE